MNKNPLSHALGFGCGVLALWLWNYLSGRFGFHYTFNFLLVTIALLGTTIYTFGIAAFASLGSVSEGRFRMAVLSILLLGTFGWLPSFTHTGSFLLGCRQRITSAMTSDQIRLMAARATELLGAKDGVLPAPGRVRSVDYKTIYGPLWSKMLEVPGFSNLGVNFTLLTGQYGVVLEWGGGNLSGRSGLQVQAPIVTDHWGLKSNHLSIAPDIEVYVSD